MLDDTLLPIEVAFADSQLTKVIVLGVAPGTTIEEAIMQSGICQYFPQISLEAVGISGELKTLTTVVSAGDRVEIYRPLHQSAMALRQAKVLVKAKPKSKPRQRPVRDLG